MGDKVIFKFEEQAFYLSSFLHFWREGRFLTDQNKTVPSMQEFIYITKSKNLVNLAYCDIAYSVAQQVVEKEGTDDFGKARLFS